MLRADPRPADAAEEFATRSANAPLLEFVRRAYRVRMLYPYQKRVRAECGNGVFPTVLFIFPSMFLVILGPALLNFGEIF